MERGIIVMIHTVVEYLEGRINKVQVHMYYSTSNHDNPLQNFEFKKIYPHYNRILKY